MYSDESLTLLRSIMNEMNMCKTVCLSIIPSYTSSLEQGDGIHDLKDCISRYPLHMFKSFMSTYGICNFQTDSLQSMKDYLNHHNPITYAHECTYIRSPLHNPVRGLYCNSNQDVRTGAAKARDGHNPPFSDFFRCKEKEGYKPSHPSQPFPPLRKSYTEVRTRQGESGFYKSSVVPTIPVSNLPDSA